ncbi:hypothetical protein ACLQ2R_08195 [Streptosporangium sp. DT93]|uniref:hypothetical protein n=1 Tax=Streptosporangium sp. DT93 TaxID=3393428 RepID=UPI003CF69014
MSIEPDDTMFVALHGELALHPWRDPLVASSDAYSLFLARSSAMGWLTEATRSASGGLWGMNDAGQGPGVGPEPSHIAWFQVSLTAPVPEDRPLPVQAFLSCAGDVTARLGDLTLRAVQVLLPVPVRGPDPSAGTSPPLGGVIPLLQDAGWFADGDPRRRTPVRVTLDGGQDPSVRSAAPGMLRWMRGFDQDVLVCDSFSLTDDHPIPASPVIDELWHGPARHRVTFHGVLTEWSTDALGWLAALFAEAASLHGVGTPLMLTADRPEKS